MVAGGKPDAEQISLDEQLVERVLQGDQVAVAHLAEHHLGPPLQRFFIGKPLQCQGCLADLSADIMAEIFKGGQWRVLRNWNRDATLKTYLRSTVFRVGNRKCRRCRSYSARQVSLDNGRCPDPVVREPDGPSLAFSKERRGMILSAIRRLKNPHQQVVILRVFFRGETVKEVAAFLGIPENSASQIKKRALDKLRDLLPADLFLEA